MSIVSGPVLKVSNVQILAGVVYPAKVVQRRDKTTGRIRRFKTPEGKPMQLTIYSNQITKERSRENAVMVLPFPQMQKTKRFKILDMSNYDEVCSDFNQFFKNVAIRTEGINWNTWDDDDDIRDIATDKYKTNVMASYRELEKYKKTLSISDEVMNNLKQYYKNNYGFIVCQLSGTARYAPIAFIHELMLGDKLFIPTRHIHGRVNVASSLHFDENNNELEDLMKESMLVADSYIKHKIKRNTISSCTIQAKNDWDHQIFIINRHDLPQNSVFTQQNIMIESGKQSMIDNYKNFIKVANIPNEITFNGIHSIHRITIYPKYRQNHDFVL
jgi:hypothetical protein